ncbi:PREDICTED: 40S ribosomal protein S30-like [Erythranthe guttata]|uniref:40S ribosomal protein S30-like n=1 Tax=Erythranthe guttata TaxID=4155 RepID=UPI00064DEBCE|nr:PREDICTED: 40S ribosomal protein S30-like [Erythranthe guttata]XP_012839457.1 PREDICTED: 40S ribosomal protein S30-like [Erythranthe guttata]|eukprot:XP_012839456.1 PREDICTED: 40S ribosomal protein S30-like [Erythranthe guttata]
MGKVHGSLAREKTDSQGGEAGVQDQKKKPCGHTHKHMQYNGRFVSVNVDFGKKRGPNSSEK